MITFGLNIAIAIVSIETKAQIKIINIPWQ